MGKVVISGEVDLLFLNLSLVSASHHIKSIDEEYVHQFVGKYALRSEDEGLCVLPVNQVI